MHQFHQFSFENIFPSPKPFTIFRDFHAVFDVNEVCNIVSGPLAYLLWNDFVDNLFAQFADESTALHEVQFLRSGCFLFRGVAACLDISELAHGIPANHMITTTTVNMNSARPPSVRSQNLPTDSSLGHPRNSSHPSIIL